MSLLLRSSTAHLRRHPWQLVFALLGIALGVVALLIGEVRSRRARSAAALGALIALVLVPFAPAGVPVLVASAGALIGLRRRA